MTRLVGPIYYAVAAFTAFMAFVTLWFGNWGAAAWGFALALWVGGHPWMRRSWYEIGYADGYDSAVEAMTQT